MSRLKKLFLIETPLSCLALLVALVFTLTLPGCGGGGGGSRSGGKDVMIMPPANRAPTAGQAFANISLTYESGNPGRWRSNGLDTYFSDPDSDSLSYTASSSNQGVAGAVIGESLPPVLVVETRGAGSAVITVTAADPSGLTASQSFTVTTTLENQPPAVARTFENITLTLTDDDPSTGRWASGYLDAYFSDPEGGALNYKWQSSDENVAVVRIDNELQPPSGTNAGTPLGLVVEARGAGIATVSVTATDPHGASTTQRFSIGVSDNRTVVEPPPADHPDTQAGAARIASGETVRGDFHSQQDVDWFRLDVTEPSAVELRLLADPGTEISVFDLNGNLLASGVVPSGGTTGSRGPSLSARTRPSPLLLQFAIPILFVSKPVLIKLGTPVATKVIYTLAATSAPVIAKLLHDNLPEFSVKPGATNISSNIHEYLGCRFQRKDNNLEYDAIDICELEVETVTNQEIFVNGTKVGTVSIKNNDLEVDIPCQTNRGETTISVEVTIAGFKTANFEIDKSVTTTVPLTLDIIQADQEICNPEKIPGGPELAVSASPGEPISITLTDYIRDPREGLLTFTPKSVPSGVMIDRNGADWEITTSPDIAVDTTSMVITATSTKDGTELSADFTFRIFTQSCEVEMGYKIFYPTAAVSLVTIRDHNYKYTGSCMGGLANGQGTYSVDNVGYTSSYTGGWKDGRPHGRGRLRISGNGIVYGGGSGIVSVYEYDGEWQNGVQYGHATLTSNSYDANRNWVDRSQYVGEFVNNEYHGRGRLEFRYRNVYDDFQAGFTRGVKEGEFYRNEIRNGTETFYDENGFHFRCSYVNGNGSCVYADR